MKVFFSYASEDKYEVEQIFLRMIEKYPELNGWFDKYEVLGGQDLIDKIHEGIKNSDKFLIFLSEKSIYKPWVKAELKSALMQEIRDGKQDFIIPVLISSIKEFPPFLDSKHYISVFNKTESEWLDEVYRAIVEKKKPYETSEPNLQISINRAQDDENAALVIFRAKNWAEELHYLVTTKKPIKTVIWSFPNLKGANTFNFVDRKEIYTYAIKASEPRVRKDNPFIIGIVFDQSNDPVKDIISVGEWDGIGGSTHNAMFNNGIKFQV